MNFKNFGIFDIAFIKWSSIAFTLFVVSAYPPFTNLVINTHWALFLFISLVFAIKPIYSIFKK